MIALIKKVTLILFLLLFSSIIYISEVKLSSRKESLFSPSSPRIPLSPGVLKIMVLNNELLFADLLYLRTLLYSGEFLNSEETHWLFTYFDTITELDPKFEYAYILGGINLSVFCYNGELSNRILLKGLNQFRENWKIPFLIGYNYYYELADFYNGARYFEIASKLPSAPLWLPFLTAKLYSTAGDIDTAIEFLKGMLAITKDKKIREGLQKKLKLAIIEKGIRPLEKAVKTYKKLYGKFPANLNDVVKKGLIKEIPVEPFGGYFYIDRDGNVWSSTIRERLKIYIPEDLGWKLEKSRDN